MKKNPIFFIHPPKSAGSTVISFFDLNVGAGGFANFEWGSSGWQPAREIFLRSGVGGGHQPYGMHSALRLALDYCTIVRDPLARQISHYWYARNGKNGAVARGTSVTPLEGSVQRGEVSLDEWIEKSLAGTNVFVQMLSGHPAVDEKSLEVALVNLERHITTAGTCEDMSAFLLRLCGRAGFEFPFYINTNSTEKSGKDAAPTSEAAVDIFKRSNSLDYALFRHVKERVDNEIRNQGAVFHRALGVVKAVQSEINKLENPYSHRSILSGFDPDYLDHVRQVARSFDLGPIEEYVRVCQAQQPTDFDMYDGCVDSVNDRVVSGWVVNLNHPEKKVLVEICVGDRVVASSLTGGYRPDLTEAGYPTSEAGFSIQLPESAMGGFRVAVAGSSEMLHGTGTWQCGWHRA
ncbi:chondroitin 4-O-sulfotransferase [Paraburkholderia sediminicola]|uniref:chondroitin 4-O-sulfotransferase n=1 Tax=Paraburkholderia sediminicola TaxID=458836 RepID=UPI000EB387B6